MLNRTHTASQILPGLCLLLSSALATAGAEPGDAIELPTQGFERAIELRETLSREEQDWARHKSILEAEIALLRQRLAGAEEEITSLERQQTEALEKREELLRERDRETEWMEAMETVREEVAPQLESLDRSLPEWLPRELQDAPEANEDTYLWLEARLNRVAEILLWNSRVETEVRRIQPDSGNERRVDVLSFGLAGAYYTSPDGSHAGYYVFQDGKWRRKENPDGGAVLLEALRQQKGTSAPDLIPLPVELGEEDGQ